MTTIKYLPELDDPCENACDTMAEAVLACAAHDGHGAAYKRMSDVDEDSTDDSMYLFQSRNSIGNNPYFPVAKDNCGVASDNTDDAAAIAEVGDNQIVSGLWFNGRRRFSVRELTFDDAGLLIEIDGQTFEEMAKDSDSSAEDLCKYFMQFV